MKGLNLKSGIKKIVVGAVAFSLTITPIGVQAYGTTINEDTNSIKVYQTVKGSLMDEQLEDLHFKAYSQEDDTKKTIRVYPGEERQTILGIGGAITEASAYNLTLLTEAQQKEVYDAYFSKEGANYSIIRSSIGSADFSVKSYSYDDTDYPDVELKEFSIEKDREYLLPAIKKALRYNSDIKFFAAPWAPPAWMKKSGVRRGQTGTAGLGLIDNSLDTRYFDSYANYFVKYIKAYQNEGIDVYSISLQNESQNNPKWEACTWSIEDTADFIGNHLGPKLEENGLNPKVLIWDWDKGNDPMHRDGFIKYNLGVLNDSNARKYIDGIAFHWYAGDVFHEIAGKPMWSEDFYSLDEVKSVHPDINLYATEACQEKGPWLHSFEPAERYIYDIINDFEHGSKSFIDWNILLDHDGGPTQGVINKCHAPIMIDENKNLIYNPAYYVLKRLSKELRPNSVSIKTDANFDSVVKTAVKDVNGQISIMIGNIKDYEQNVNVVDSGKVVKVKLPAHSMTTLVYSQSTDMKLMKPISANASSYEWNPFKDYKAKMAIDDNVWSRWASDWKDEEYIDFELDEERVLAGINIMFECGQDAEFEIQYARDNNLDDFVTIAHIDKETYRQQKNINILFDDFVSSKYLRFKGISRNNRYGYSIYDVNIMGY